jgi:hypothetical protein
MVAPRFIANPVAEDCITTFTRQDDRRRFRPKDVARPPSADQHFGGQKGLPSKQKPSVGVIFPEVVQT